MSKDLPNFAAWSHENLANFARESYIKMQEQHEEIEFLKLSTRDQTLLIQRFMNAAEVGDA